MTTIPTMTSRKTLINFSPLVDYGDWLNDIYKGRYRGLIFSSSSSLFYVSTIIFSCRMFEKKKTDFHYTQKYLNFQLQTEVFRFNSKLLRLHTVGNVCLTD